MPYWIHSPQSIYVLAAYGVAGFGLLSLLAFSCLAWVRAKAKWLNSYRIRHESRLFR